MSGARALPAIGLAVVGVAAAVLSYSALADLAAMVGTTIPALYPVAVDAALAVSTAIWLGGAPAAGLTPARRFARTMTWALLVATVAGNALHQGLRSAGLDAPWWVAVLVGAVPPAVLGSTVHLAVLVGRTEPPATGEESKVDRPVETVRPTEPDRPKPAKTVRATADRPAKQEWTDAEILAALADGPLTRNEIVRRFGVGGPRATRLLAESRQKEAA